MWAETHGWWLGAHGLNIDLGDREHDISYLGMAIAIRLNFICSDL